MKKYFLIIFLFFTASILFISCKKFLDKNPDSRAELNNAEKITQLLTTAYPNASYASFTEAMSDNANDKAKSQVEDINILLAYLFEDNVDDDDQDTPGFYWSNCYSAIAAANQALDAIASMQNPDGFNAQKGEALICRAYAHFMLVNLFAKSYDEATAASDPGIPYVTEPETVVFKNYDRGTVKSVYENVENDLTTGLPLINDAIYTVPKFHFTKKAANAFASRFYLFKKDYAKAAQYASATYPNNDFGANMRPWTTTYKTYTFNELVAAYTKDDQTANILLCNAGSLYARNYATRNYGVRTDTLLTNIRKSPSAAGSASWAYSIYLYSQDDYFIPKWDEFFAESFPGAGYGLPYIMMPLFTTEEILFNRAEAYTYLGQYDNALADINTFCSKRITSYNPSTQSVTLAKALAYYNTSDPKEALIRTILDYRRLEFVFEGMRWFDNCRYKMKVVHPIRKIGEPNTILDSVVNTAESKTRLLQIPQSATKSGVPLNPR